MQRNNARLPATSLEIYWQIGKFPIASSVPTSELLIGVAKKGASEVASGPRSRLNVFSASEDCSSFIIERGATLFQTYAVNFNPGRTIDC